MKGMKHIKEREAVLNIYAHTFMTATRNPTCIKVKSEQRRGWLRRKTRCIDPDKL